MQEIYLMQIENIFINNSKKDILHNQNLYKSTNNFHLKSFILKTNLEPATCKFEFIFTQSMESKDEIFSIFHNKKICVLTQKNLDISTMTEGIVAEIQILTGSFTITIKSNLYKFAKPITKKYSPTCRASFCDANCQLQIEDYSQTQTVISFNENILHVENLLPNYRWNNGICIINNISHTIKSVENKKITLFETPKTQDITSATLIPNCNKTLENCKAYQNILNFQGEPFIG